MTQKETTAMFNQSQKQAFEFIPYGIYKRNALRFKIRYVSILNEKCKTVETTLFRAVRSYSGRLISGALERTSQEVLDFGIK